MRSWCQNPGTYLSCSILVSITELFLLILLLLSNWFAPLSPVSFKPVCFPWQHQMYLFPKRICDLDSLPLARSLALAPSPGASTPGLCRPAAWLQRPSPLRAPRRGAACNGRGEAGIPTPASPTREGCSGASSLDGSKNPLQTPAAVTLLLCWQRHSSHQRRSRNAYCRDFMPTSTTAVLAAAAEGAVLLLPLTVWSEVK